MHTIRKIINITDKVILLHKYKFVNAREAAKFNTSILKQSKYDFTKVLQKEQGIMLEPGSEFRSHNTLKLLLFRHEHWDKMEQIITEGVSYPLKHLPEQIRQEDLDFMIERGNHKSAT